MYPLLQVGMLAPGDSMKLPGFTATETVYPSRGYRARTLPGSPSPVDPQFLFRPLCYFRCARGCQSAAENDPDFDKEGCLAVCETCLSPKDP